MSHRIVLASKRIRPRYFHSSSRCLSSSSASSSSSDGDGGGEAAESTLTEAVAAAASPPPTTTSLTELFLPDASAPVATAASLLDSLGPNSNALISLPWWAAIPTAAVAVRVSLLPLAAAQARSAAAFGPLLQRARQEAAAEAEAVPSSSEVPEKEEYGGDSNKETETRKQKRPPPLSSTLRHLRRLRAETSSPSPAWLVASPLLQIPVFASAVLGVRAMAAARWPGFSEGGALWFTDLTARAVEVVSNPSISSSLASMTAPMGIAGGILPACVAAGTLAAAALGPGRTTAAVASPSRPSPQVPASSLLRVLLEWLALPAFAGSLALPQGAVLYWASSTAAALAQGAVLRSEQARRVLGLREIAERAAAAGRGKGSTPSPVPPPSTAAVLAHLTRAAELRASGDIETAIRAASAAVEAATRASSSSSSSLSSDDDERRRQQTLLGAARAFFALGQLRTTAAHWHDGELAFGECARLEEEAITEAEKEKKMIPSSSSPSSALFLRERKHEVARALFGAGVCQSMQGDNEAASGTLRRACAAAETAAAAEGKDDVAAAARATLARSSLALSSSLDALGKTREALEAAERAAKYDKSVRKMAVEPLREKLRRPREEK